MGECAGVCIFFYWMLFGGTRRFQFQIFHWSCLLIPLYHTHCKMSNIYCILQCEQKLVKDRLPKENPRLYPGGSTAAYRCIKNFFMDYDIDKEAVTDYNKILQKKKIKLYIALCENLQTKYSEQTKLTRSAGSRSRCSQDLNQLYLS